MGAITHTRRNLLSTVIPAATVSSDLVGPLPEADSFALVAETDPGGGRMGATGAEGRPSARDGRPSSIGSSPPMEVTTTDVGGERLSRGWFLRSKTAQKTSFVETVGYQPRSNFSRGLSSTMDQDSIHESRPRIRPAPNAPRPNSKNT